MGKEFKNCQENEVYAINNELMSTVFISKNDATQKYLVAEAKDMGVGLPDEMLEIQTERSKSYLDDVYFVKYLGNGLFQEYFSQYILEQGYEKSFDNYFDFKDELEGHSMQSPIVLHNVMDITDAMKKRFFEENEHAKDYKFKMERLLIAARKNMRGQIQDLANPKQPVVGVGANTSTDSDENKIGKVNELIKNFSQPVRIR